MEMQQIRYFLALTRTLNFTRAAEECNVSQPALTRAIQALETELGGDLIRREHSRSHLTELGKRMAPLLQRCYESAISAKALAKSIAEDDVAPLTLAVSNSVNVELIMPAVGELFRSFPGLQLKLLKGGAGEIVALLKDGDAELAIAGPLEDAWERLDHWALFTEPFEAAAPRGHPLSRENDVSVEKLKSEPLFVQFSCESRDVMARRLEAAGVAIASLHEVGTLHDLVTIAGNDVGISLLPHSAPSLDSVRRVPVSDLDVSRTVSIYAVAGRRRDPAAAAFLNLMRSGDHSPGA